MSDFAYLDIVLTVIAAILIFRGLTRGFVEEFFSLGAVIVGALAAFMFHSNVAAYIRENYLNDFWGLPELLGFLAVFIAVFIVSKILQKIFNDIINGMKLSGLNKILGGALGFVEGVVVIAILLFIINIQPFFDSGDILHGSLFGRILLPLMNERDIMEIIDITFFYASGYFG